MVRHLTLAALAVAVAITAEPAAAGDARAGAAIALRWCAACHAIAPDQTGPVAEAPSFSAIAARRDDAALLRFLTDPHPTMKGLSLSRAEIADVIAYIRTEAR